jgi:hypothetical protein
MEKELERAVKLLLGNAYASTLGKADREPARRIKTTSKNCVHASA